MIKPLIFVGREMLNKSKAKHDLISIAIVGLLAYLVAIEINLFERMAGWVTRHENWQLDEFLSLSLILTVALAVYSTRRWREYLEAHAGESKAIKALAESEERYRQITENSLAGIFLCQDGVTVYVNKRLAEMLGCRPEELLGVGFLDRIHADDRGLIRKLAENEFSEEVEPSRYELRLLHKDGRTVWSEALVHRMVYQGHSATLGNIVDITEKRSLEDQLRQAQKMEAIGTLAGGIAHDFNNLLHVILGHAELLDLELAERGMKFSEMDVVREAADRGADLVRQILTFSRKAPLRFKVINLNREVKRTAKILYRTLPKMIALDVKTEETLEYIRADSAQIEQMLLNLATNANDAMPNGGRLTIETRNVNLDRSYGPLPTGVAPGRYVHLRVSDIGHGIEPQVMPHIFEPFFTTKGLADGTGLGLATVFGAVKMHGGHITCESEVEKGTTFNVYFPVADTTDQEIEQTQEAPTPDGSGEAILVVDDEVPILELGKRILEMAGYSVLTAGSGKEALEIYENAQHTISLVILDLVMPDMGGQQCLEELLKINPQAKVLIASGLAVHRETRSFLDSRAKGRVTKPFAMKALLRAVRESLDRA